MPSVRKIARREWEETPRDYKGISTILVCRHCDEWTFKWRPDLIPAECASTAGHEWIERKQRTMLARDERGTFLELVEVIEMDELKFAEALGFDSYESLMQASELVVRAGFIDWFITQFPDGRWAAWDDAELALDRVAHFDTREEAIEFHRDTYGYTLSLDDFLTERSGREAVCLPWEEVENLLGGYDGTEDEKLINDLKKMTAAKGWPKWIDDPAARKVVTDDAGWWLVGPRVEKD